jgi:hypothetical protein
LRDPDGYYVEVGNSTVLTKFVLGHDLYDSFARPLDEKKKCPFKLKYIVKLMILCQKAKKRMQHSGSLRKFLEDRSSFESEDVLVNEAYLTNLLKRTKNYADITQKQNEASLR